MEYTSFVPIGANFDMRGGEQMAEVRVGENEPFENALKRFKTQVSKSGIIADVKKREQYDKPSVKRKKKAENARKRRYK